MTSHQGAKWKNGNGNYCRLRLRFLGNHLFDRSIDRDRREVVGFSGWNISMVLWSFGFISSTGVLSCIAHNRTELGVGRQGFVSMISGQTSHHGQGGWLPTGAYRVLHDFYCVIICTAAVLTSPRKVCAETQNLHHFLCYNMKCWQTQKFEPPFSFCLGLI